jgi:hypothetical protein
MTFKEKVEKKMEELEYTAMGASCRHHRDILEYIHRCASCIIEPVVNIIDCNIWRAVSWPSRHLRNRAFALQPSEPSGGFFALRKLMANGFNHC